jgi:TRAP transporter TAXI family solute receptor
MGVALSQIYGKAMPGAKTSAQVTKASAENLNLLQAGRGEIAFTLGDALNEAWKGNEEAGFKTPLKKLRTIAAIYPNYIQIVANADSGIKTLADLKGKRVAVGAPKSGTELNARDIFKGAGMSYKDFAKVEYLPFGESVELMKNRQLDATLISAGLGVAAIRDLATSVKIVIVPIPADVVAKIGEAAYQPGTVPANTYNGQTDAVAHRGDPELPGQPRRRVGRRRLQDDQGHLRAPARTAGRACRGQGHHQGERRQGAAGAAACGCREVLQGRSKSYTARTGKSVLIK